MPIKTWSNQKIIIHWLKKKKCGRKLGSWRDVSPGSVFCTGRCAWTLRTPIFNFKGMSYSCTYFPVFATTPSKYLLPQLMSVVLRKEGQDGSLWVAGDGWGTWSPELDEATLTIGGWIYPEELGCSRELTHELTQTKPLPSPETLER